jgi:hypothetical protein
MTENNPIPANPAGSSIGRRVATGAVLVALPVAAGTLYLKTRDAAEERDRALERGTQYDMAALQKVDPALIKWHEAGRIDTGIASARAIAVDRSGNVLVGGDGIVRRLSAAGQRLGDIAIKGAVQTLATDADGAVYVGLKDHVEVYGPEGTKKLAFPSLGEDAYITSIAVGGGNVYIGDFGHKLVYRTDMTGKVINTIGKADPGKGVPGLLLPSPHMDVAVAADGSVWVANTGRHRLENYTAEGDIKFFWGKSGSEIENFAGCCNPADFWLLGDGSFITAEKGVARLKRYLPSPDFRFESVVAAASSFPGNMTGLDVTSDARGRVVVLARGTTVVQIFEPNRAAQ